MLFFSTMKLEDIVILNQIKGFGLLYTDKEKEKAKEIVSYLAKRHDDIAYSEKAIYELMESKENTNFETKYHFRIGHNTFGDIKELWLIAFGYNKQNDIEVYNTMIKPLKEEVQEKFKSYFE